MGYQAKPVRQRVFFHPYLAPLVNPLTHRFAKSLSAARPTSRLLAKAEGMLRGSMAEKGTAVSAIPSCEDVHTIHND
jgi:hypothetical protein